MRNIKIVIICLALITSGIAGTLPPYAFKSMTCTFDGLEVPSFSVKLTHDEVVITGENKVWALLKAKDIAADFSSVKRPVVTGGRAGGIVGVSIYIETWRPSGGVFIYVIGDNAWAMRTSSPQIWLNLTSGERLDGMPKQVTDFHEAMNEKLQVSSPARKGEVVDPFSAKDTNNSP